MSHWSEDARNAANRSMGTGATDSPVVDCEDREWEALADVEEIRQWELLAEVPEIGFDDLQDPRSVAPPAPTPAQGSPGTD